MAKEQGREDRRRSLGDYLKEQRVAARLSLRQLAEQAGVSNPYLSQIERGLRRPSAEVLQQIAKALRISAEQLYVRPGSSARRTASGGSVELAVLDDTGLTERQKQSLLDVYASFLALNDGPADDDAEPTAITTDQASTSTANPKEMNMAKAKFDIKTEATQARLRRRRRHRPRRRGRPRRRRRRAEAVSPASRRTSRQLDFEPRRCATRPSPS